MISIHKPGSPMCSPASPASRRGGFANCCHGIGAPMSGLSRRLKQLDEELLALGEETLRPDALQKLLNADADTAAAMRGMMALADVVCRDRHLPRTVDCSGRGAPTCDTVVNAATAALTRGLRHTLGRHSRHRL